VVAFDYSNSATLGEFWGQSMEEKNDLLVLSWMEKD